MKLFIFIEREKFLRDMVELCVKGSETDVLTLDSAGESIHFIDDLRPELILVDIQTVLSHMDSFFDGIGKLGQECKIVLTGDEGDRELIREYDNKTVGFIKKPLSPTGLIDRLKKFL